MLKKTVKYTDFNGVERTEDFYFNLSKTELQEMESSIPGGMSARLTTIQAANDINEVMKFFKFIIMKSYGEKSPDGRRLIKEDGKLAEAFVETPAYDIIFQEFFVSEGNALRDFLLAIVPADISAQITKSLDNGN
ncbi:MAG: hypothetical protein J6Y20_05400 [Lachnospiraceae bacterium]|nr:hypothetical protein [Lachnospiraceae bacterium]